jgi:hypothetical protein
LPITADIIHHRLLLLLLLLGGATHMLTRQDTTICQAANQHYCSHLSNSVVQLVIPAAVPSHCSSSTVRLAKRHRRLCRYYCLWHLLLL